MTERTHIPVYLFSGDCRPVAITDKLGVTCPRRIRMPILSALTRLHRNALSLLAVLLIIATGLSAAPAHAQPAELDLGDLEVFNVDTSPRATRTIAVGPGTVSQLYFRLDIETLGSHDLSQFRLDVRAPNGATETYLITGSGTGRFEIEGGVPVGFAGDTPGQWRFEFYSTAGGTTEAFYLHPGSFVRLIGVEVTDPFELSLTPDTVTLIRGQAMDEITATLSGG